MNENQTDDVTASGRKTVLYDGSCPMCAAILEKIDRSPQGERFDRVDIATDPLPSFLTKGEVEKEIHLIDEEGRLYKNAAAILKILEEYPRLRFLAKIGRLPIIKQTLPIGYSFVAANRHFIIGSASRIYWLKVVLSLACISGFLLSTKLWLTSRTYPLTPVSEILPGIPFPIDYVLLVLMLLSLGAIIISARPRKYIAAFVVVSGLLSLGDQSRWQPWFYQYLFMFAALGFYSWKAAEANAQGPTLNVCRLIVASIYLWSGFQKINVNFVGGVFPWMVKPLVSFLPPGLKVIALSLGVSVPFLEIGIGIGLLTRRFRNVAVGLALAMHVSILMCIGPLGYNWNSVVWPWNVAMALFVFILFWKEPDARPREILSTKRSLFHTLVCVLFGIMPAFSLIDLWDSYLSSALYSGNTAEAVVYVSDPVIGRLPTEIQKFARGQHEAGNVLSISRWSFEELNVPPYPEERIFKNVARTICAYAEKASDVMLTIEGRPNWLTGERATTSHDCSNL
jgi:predicted DCC family thiol-disulfide oxidoreductase YuxK